MSPLPPLSTKGLDPFTRIRARIIERRVAARNRKAEQFLRSTPHLWQAIEDYKKVSDVTGASMSDYRTLYEQVRQYKPREILELGTGFSSVILAHALMENEKEGAPKGRITSMEEHKGWYDKASEVLPENVSDHVEIIHSPKVDGFYKIFRGVQYREIPDRNYDFIFSDGPERHSTVNGDKLFDLDLVQIVRRSEKTHSSCRRQSLSDILRVAKSFWNRACPIQCFPSADVCGACDEARCPAVTKGKLLAGFKARGHDRTQNAHGPLSLFL